MRRPRKAEGAFPTVEKYNELVDVVNYLMDNALVTAGSGLSTQQMPQGRAVVSNVDVNLKFYRLLGAEPIDDVSWLYSVEEVRYTPAGWETITVPKEFYPAINTCESNGLATDPAPELTIVAGRKTSDIGTGTDGVLFAFNVGEGTQLGMTPGIILSSEAAVQSGKYVYTWGRAVFTPDTTATAYDGWSLEDEYGIQYQAFNEVEVPDSEDHEAIPDGTVIRVHTHLHPDTAEPFFWFHSSRGGSGAAASPAIYGFITDSTRDASNSEKFIYTWREAIFAGDEYSTEATAYNSWTYKYPDGGGQHTAFNLDEIADNGVYSAIPDGTLVRLTLEHPVDTAEPWADLGGDPVYWFSAHDTEYPAIVIESFEDDEHPGKWSYSCKRVELTDGEYHADWATTTRLDTTAFRVSNSLEYPDTTYYYRPIPDGTVIMVRDMFVNGEMTRMHYCSVSMNQDTNLVRTGMITVPEDQFTWSLAADPGQPVDIRVVSNVVWDITDAEWKQQMCVLSFDDGGRLISVTVESELELITVTVSC